MHICASKAKVARTQRDAGLHVSNKGGSRSGDLADQAAGSGGQDRFVKAYWILRHESTDPTDIVDYIAAEDPRAALEMDELFSAAAAGMEDFPMLGYVWASCVIGSVPALHRRRTQAATFFGVV